MNAVSSIAVRTLLYVGEVATILGISPRSVARKMDAGMLKGESLDSKHRRIYASSVREYMVTNGMDVTRLEDHLSRFS